MSEDLRPAEWRARLEARPLPLDGPAPWEASTGDDAYGAAAESLAHAMLVLVDQSPELLDVTAERERDATGWEAANNEKLWRAVKERWPGVDDWLGGISGFQYGWAHNIVRYVVGEAPAGNPAIVTIEKAV